MNDDAEGLSVQGEVQGEVLGKAALSDEDLARACGVALRWVHDRVEAGILQVNMQSGSWRFDSLTLIRARRIADLESTYDADPQLAALTVDLIEEVRHLRRRLETLRGGEVRDA